MINITACEASCWCNTQTDNQVSRHIQLGLLLIFIIWLLVSTSRINDQQADPQEHTRTKHTATQHHDVGDLHLYTKSKLKLYVQCIKI